MVALLVAVNVLVILWQVFTADQKRYARDSGKLAAMQAALLFAEKLEGDLREIALTNPDPPDREFSLDRPVKIEDNGRKLGFLKFAKHDPASPLVKVERVTYSFRPDDFRIIRSVGPDSEVLKTMIVESIRYELIPLVARVDQLGLTPPPVTFRPQVQMAFLKYEITATPEQGKGRTPADVAPEQKATIVNSIALMYRADRANHPYWSFSGSELLDAP